MDRAISTVEGGDGVRGVERCDGSVCKFEEGEKNGLRL